jgi:hypothetical protein
VPCCAAWFVCKSVCKPSSQSVLRRIEICEDLGDGRVRLGSEIKKYDELNHPKRHDRSGQGPTHL